MRPISRWIIPLTVSLLIGTPGQAQETAGHAMVHRMMSRSAERVRHRSELAGRVDETFDRDSLRLRVLSGLRRSADSTVQAWFTHFSVLMNGLDRESCNSLAAGRPDPRAIVAYVGTKDSVALQVWLTDWEEAAVASYVGYKHPPIPDDAMLAILFGMMGDIARESVDSVPENDRECWRLRAFFHQVVRLAPEQQLVVYRSIVEQMMSKKPA
jgi:hypothetical protein